eukprot:gene3728-2626_t
MGQQSKDNRDKCRKRTTINNKNKTNKPIKTEQTGVAAEQGGRTGTPMQNKRTRTAVARQRYNSIQCFRGRCTRQSAVSYR